MDAVVIRGSDCCTYCRGTDSCSAGRGTHTPSAMNIGAAIDAAMITAAVIGAAVINTSMPTCGAHMPCADSAACKGISRNERHA